MSRADSESRNKRKSKKKENKKYPYKKGGKFRSSDSVKTK
jgi:hypothetical protein